MEKLKYYLEKYKNIGIIGLIILVILILVIINLCSNHGEMEYVEKINNEINNELSEKDEKDEKEVKVDIKGFVKNPGVYKLNSNDRVLDAINAAGDLLEGANTDYLNLSRKITDEMVIIVYSNDEISKFKETDKEIIYIEKECKCPDNENDACINSLDVVNTIKNNTNKTTTSGSTNNMVSINTGTMEELMTLSGIGEAKAKLIIEYRNQNGGFKSIDELKNIKGIGESIYSKIKEHIKL